MADAASMSGGKIAEAMLEAWAKKLARGASLRVGFLEGATHSRSNLPIGAIAAIHEFGAPNAKIPPRPFLRPTITKHSEEWGDQLAAQLKRTDYDGETSLGVMGELIVSEIQEAITDVHEPALSKITLMLRKMRSKDQSLVVTGKTVGEAAARVAAGESTAGVNEKPLIDTDEMRRAAAYEVKA